MLRSSLRSWCGADTRSLSSAGPTTATWMATTGESGCVGYRWCELPVWETLIYTLMATVASLRDGYDVVQFHSLGPSTFSWLPRLFGRRVTCTVHSIDWKHSQWGPMARLAFRFGEFAAVHFPHVTISVSRALADELESRHGRRRNLRVIPNGVPPADFRNSAELGAFGLEPGYALFVGRLVPEKGPHILVEAAAAFPHRQFVIVGGSRYSDRYVEKLHQDAGPNVLFTGYREGTELAALFSHCAFLVCPSFQEGFGLTLAEAWSYGKAVIASDIPTLSSFVGEGGLLFEVGNVEALRRTLTVAFSDPQMMAAQGASGRRLVQEHFRWPDIAAQTEVLLVGRG